VLEARGSPARKFSFYLHLVLARAAQRRFLVDEADLADLRRALAAAAQGDEEKDAGYAMLFLGRFLWLHGDLDEAREHLERALAMAERIGESILRAQSLLGLALTALRRHDAEAVRVLMPRVLAEVDGWASADYLAAAKSCQAWLAWQDGRRDDVVKLSGEIAALMTPDTDPWAYHGLVHLWPMVAAHLDAGDVAAAVEAVREFPRYAPPIPADLGQAVAAAIAAWDAAQPDLAQTHLTAALTQARTLAYL
jgi:tetratricopeptide (TPR) repeat protein